jgi:serine/threonine protein kinase
MKQDIKINGITYKEIEKVSEGSFGFISVVKPKDPVLFCKKYLYKGEKSKIKIALKRMVAIGKEKVDLAKKEVKFLKTYSNHSNPYFVQYFDSMVNTNSFKNEGEFYILMEYREKGTLWDLIATKFEKKEYFDEEMILK